ncbi:MAG: phosphatidylserine/phosphatidylglycerophosphate/cardiolipin synthase family protein, partial [Verrucomicrobia bacterium]|nr:phosphatidylserine/phosphatidylglycerophosphate/cardiolipin synthase family protein [Verrucomicrobiota bacterium]
RPEGLATVPCMTAYVGPTYRWLRTGDEAFAAMLTAIERARASIALEVYIFSGDLLGQRFRDALVRACARAVRVRVLVDAFGSLTLDYDFWEPLERAGGQFRWFNPLSLGRLEFRDHRKLLVCDGRLAIVGGFNIAGEYEGDGISRGWHDLGLQLEGTLAGQLETAFEHSFARADFRYKRFMRLRRLPVPNTIFAPDGAVLLSGPGRGFNPIKRALKHDLLGAGSAKIISAYFLPTWRIRRELTRLARRGGRVQLILAGRSDVPLSQLATRRLYAGLLRAGIEIYEYRPQILHAKLIVLDDIVYIGSANLDTRSLHINYELLVRLPSPTLAAEARAIFDEDLEHCRRIDPAAWRRSRTFWNKLKERWAYFLLVRVDRYVARRQLKTLR